MPVAGSHVCTPVLRLFFLLGMKGLSNILWFFFFFFQLGNNLFNYRFIYNMRTNKGRWGTVTSVCTNALWTTLTLAHNQLQLISPTIQCRICRGDGVACFHLCTFCPIIIPYWSYGGKIRKPISITSKSTKMGRLCNYCIWRYTQLILQSLCWSLDSTYILFCTKCFLNCMVVVWNNGYLKYAFKVRGLWS